MLQVYDNHLDESEQLRFIDGELDQSELDGVEQHLAVCVECQDVVSDLAAASDGLTAFLHESDYGARAMVYPAGKRRGFWINPWAAAAAVVMLFGGVAIPRMLMPPNLPGWTTGEPAVFGRSQRFHTEVEHFILEFNSWQASGNLQLIFDDTDLFTYRNNRTGETSTMVDSEIGLMEIRTSADSDADHELVVPFALAYKFVVRVAGETVPFQQDLSLGPTGQNPDGIVAFGQVITLELGATGRAR